MRIHLSHPHVPTTVSVVRRGILVSVRARFQATVAPRRVQSGPFLVPTGQQKAAPLFAFPSAPPPWGESLRLQNAHEQLSCFVTVAVVFAFFTGRIFALTSPFGVSPETCILPAKLDGTLPQQPRAERSAALDRPPAPSMSMTPFSSDACVCLTRRPSATVAVTRRVRPPAQVRSRLGSHSRPHPRSTRSYITCKRAYLRSSTHLHFTSHSHLHSRFLRPTPLATGSKTPTPRQQRPRGLQQAFPHSIRATHQPFTALSIPAQLEQFALAVFTSSAHHTARPPCSSLPHHASNRNAKSIHLIVLGLTVRKAEASALQHPDGTGEIRSDSRFHQSVLV